MCTIQEVVRVLSPTLQHAKFVAIFFYHIYQQLKSSNRRCLKMITSIPARFRRWCLKRGELSESQQLVLKNNPRLLTKSRSSPNLQTAQCQLCILLSMWFSWWQCGIFFLLFSKPVVEAQLTYMLSTAASEVRVMKNSSFFCRYCSEVVQILAW